VDATAERSLALAKIARLLKFLQQYLNQAAILRWPFEHPDVSAHNIVGRHSAPLPPAACRHVAVVVIHSKVSPVRMGSRYRYPAPGRRFPLNTCTLRGLILLSRPCCNQER
jgi:hypothetical protein